MLGLGLPLAKSEGNPMRSPSLPRNYGGSVAGGTDGSPRRGGVPELSSLGCGGGRSDGPRLTRNCGRAAEAGVT